MSKRSFKDGLKSLLSSLVNTRSASNSNTFITRVIDFVELRAIFKLGLGNKIIRIKNGYALKEPLVFNNPTDKEFYKTSLSRHVKKASSFMLGFGRGVIVINEAGADLSKPQVGDLGKYKLDVFSGDMVTASGVSIDLRDLRYMKPTHYSIRGHQFHYSRVVDFRYVEPPEFDLPLFQYGGMAEFQMIYNQMVNDGVVERASASIIEKSSTLFYKIKGFKNALQNKQEADIKNFFSMTEQARSIYGAGLIDSEDEVKNIDQKLNGLAETDQITIRRLAMVTGIPVNVLIGESVRGMNSTGATEKQLFNEMIETLQQDYYLDPINELMLRLGLSPVSFSESQNITPIEKIEYETKALTNAKLLWEMGGDPDKYLEERGVIEKDDFAKIFSPDDLDVGAVKKGKKQEAVSGEETIAKEENEIGKDIDPTASLNGAQVTALLAIIEKVATGGIKKSTAKLLIASSFPVSIEQAEDILADVTEASIDA